MSQPLNMVQLQKMVDHSKLSVRIEAIDKQLAEKYLKKNFNSNRMLKKGTLEDLVRDIKNNNFHLGWDCIAFNEQGELVNGQHRLNAIAIANTTCDFLVLRNVRHDTITNFDQGNKRSQSDRITVSGTRIHKKACCVMVSAMRTYSEHTEGGIKYSRKNYDDIIKYQYKKHSEFFDALEIDGYLQGKFQNSFLLCAFKIFTEMEVGKAANTFYPHKMGSYERAIHWLDLSIGASTNGRIFNENYDQAMYKLKDLLLNRRAKGLATRGIHTHRIFMCAASYFMKGKNTEIRPAKISKDPFTPLKALMYTNKSTNLKNLGFNQ